MKVTFVTREYPPYTYGGAGVHVKYLTRELSRLMEVEVRCFGDQDSVIDKNLKVRGYQEWDFFKNSKNGGKHSSVLATLSADLAIADGKVDSDIVHTHTWYSAFAGYLIKMLYKIPFVLTCHSLEPLRPWKVDQIGSGYDLSSWVEKLGIESADAVIAVSEEMKSDILKFFNIHPDKIKVIHNGVDLEKWRRIPSEKVRASYGIPEKYVLFFGRTTKQKGIDVLIDAAGMIDPSAKIVICTAGADTKEYLAEIEARARSKDNIIFINKMLDEDECVAIYSGASVFACPSVYEPFGIINLEAMACGVPVVASRVGGIKEIVIDGETGYFVEPGNPKQLADKINLLLADEVVSRKMGEAGRRRVEERFSWRIIARRTKELYEEIITRYRK